MHLGFFINRHLLIIQGIITSQNEVRHYDYRRFHPIHDQV